MVIRLLVLHHYLGISFSSITVVTFTKESKLDFASKLRELFELWGHTISVRDSLNIVRTFHSRILSFTKSLPGLEGVRAFEFLSQKGDEEEKDDSLFLVNLGSLQIELMNQCYAELYSKNPRFKELIGDLVKQAAFQERLDAKNPDVAKKLEKAKSMHEVDTDLCSTVEQLWREAKCWPIEGVDATGKDIQLAGQTFHANGYIESIGAYVLLGVDRTVPNDMKVPGHWQYLRASVSQKRTLFQVYCSQPVVVLSRYEDAAASISTLVNLATACPKFDYKISGEMGASNIMEAFYSAASFIENLGLDVIEAVKAMRLPKLDPDRKFFEALAIYWAAFHQHLISMSPPIMTFNAMFAMFSERGAANLKAVPDRVLQPMTTLLIDEFQDVGANTISWVRATLNEIEERDLRVTSSGLPTYPSLMAVGDDWQSIYGWRGSSPEFFINFDHYFPSPTTTPVLMQENYRSHQHVIDAAEAIVKRTGGVQGKHGIASNAAVKNDAHPVQVLDYNLNDVVIKAREHYEAGHSILVLSRARAKKDEAARALFGLLKQAKHDKRERDIKLLTYHASKGLQANAVFLLGDCDMKTTSRYKNDIFRQAQMGSASDPCGYDSSQRDEVLRIAYVAITRAVTHCYWYIEREDASKGAGDKASLLIDPARPYWRDLRGLRKTE